MQLRMCLRAFFHLNAPRELERALSLPIRRPRPILNATNFVPRDAARNSWLKMKQCGGQSFVINSVATTKCDGVPIFAGRGKGAEVYNYTYKYKENVIITLYIYIYIYICFYNSIYQLFLLYL